MSWRCFFRHRWLEYDIIESWCDYDSNPLPILIVTRRYYCRDCFSIKVFSFIKPSLVTGLVHIRSTKSFLIEELLTSDDSLYRHIGKLRGLI